MKDFFQISFKLSMMVDNTISDLDLHSRSHGCETTRISVIIRVQTSQSSQIRFVLLLKQ